ncbi:hypothetical protein [Photorhabdus sp. RW14-46]|uniref:hypothetical protein n=1 Tax=Photorhabdus sp. RW14-46 TaxID=2100168 RepID=UPI001A98A305|nr:hypothetical protein [Photorhabdus sp. RW14-46]
MIFNSQPQTIKDKSDVEKYTVETFDIEYPESRGHDAKIYGNGRNAVHIRVHIKLLNQDGTPVQIPSRKMREFLHLYDSVSKKIIWNVRGMSGNNVSGGSSDGIHSDDVVAFELPGYYSTGRYPNSGESEIQNYTAPSLDAMTLDYYVQSARSFQSPVHLSLSGYFSTTPALPDAKSITTSNNNKPPLKLTVESFIRYSDPALWTLTILDEQVKLVDAPDIKVHNIQRQHVQVAYQRYLLTHRDVFASLSGNKISIFIRSPSRSPNIFGMWPYPSGQAFFDGVKEKTAYTQAMAWVLPEHSGSINISGTVMIGSVEDTNKYIVDFNKNLKLCTVQLSEHAITVVCAKLIVTDESHFKLSGNQGSGYSEQTQATVWIEDNFGHQQKVNISFNKNTGLPSVI